MKQLTVVALRVVLGLILVGSLVVQAVIVPLLAIDLGESDGDVADVRWPIVAIVVLAIGAVQAAIVCVWRLVTMVRRGTVFSDAAFRWVDGVIGALVAEAVLVFALAVALAPGESAAPGVVGLVCGVSLGFAGIALIVFVLRLLLVQAVERDAEATELQGELAGVI